MASRSSSAVCPGCPVATITNFDPSWRESSWASTLSRYPHVVHQPLVEPARLAPREHARRQVELSVAAAEARRRRPGQVHPRQLDPCDDVERLDARERDGRRVVPGLAVGDRPGGDRAKVLLGHGERCGRVDVPRDDERGVVGDVPGAEEGLDVVERRGVEDPPASRWRAGGTGGGPGTSPRTRNCSHHAVRSVLVVLTALVLNDVALPGESRLVEAVEQEPHPVALEPEREVEAVLRDRLEVVGAVGARRAVDRRAASALEVADVACPPERACCPGTSRARTGARSRFCQPARPSSRRGTRG